MTEIGLGIFGEDKEALKLAIENFEKQKNEFQDHLLERTLIVSDAISKDIEEAFDLSSELAKTAYVLEFDYNIPRMLSANYYKSELNRLEEKQYELPDIYSFRVRFSIEEGFWIKYLTIDLPKILIKKLKKLYALDRSIFGDTEGEKDDSASYILERAYICNEIIHPILQSWIIDHHRANFYTAATSFICGIQQKAKEKADIFIKDMGNRYYSNSDMIKIILSEIPSHGWVLKAKEEFYKVSERIQKVRKDKSQMDWRIAADLILETMLVMEYDTIEMPEPDFRSKDQITRKQIVTQTISSKKTDFITDKISLVLAKIEEMNEERIIETVKELVKELYDKAIIINREKPAYFARNFIERIMMELNVNQLKITKYIKKFDSQMMNRLSAAGLKDFPNMSVDEKVIGLIEEIVLDIIKNRENLKEISIESKKQAAIAIKNGQTIGEESNTEDSLKTDEVSLRNKLLNATEKELWLLVRDEYLKELFTNAEEINSAAIVMKRFSLELGLLLTQGEALSLINNEISKMNIIIDSSNKEEIDAKVCKIVYSQIKEQRNYSK
ncbi:MAG TPA: hypothetical protein VMX55_01120 [candidate division Zixibacteria bacterium]|nr:hypothetical protein [candidate division Zixibacteria bacterium]